MKMDINIGHSGIGSKGSLNVFAQVAEPKVKDGIWIKTEGITTDEPVYLADIPYYFYDGSAVAIGTDIFLFGSYQSGYYEYAYKYNSLTNTYTKLRDIPYDFANGSVVAIGTDIYLLGGHIDSINFSYQNNYKYDTLTNTYTKLRDIPLTFYYGSAVAVGTDIYLLGGLGTNQKHNYKYDTLTNTYTKLEDMPFNFINGSAVIIGSNIFLFGSSNNDYSKDAYKYDILTNTYTKLEDIPHDFYHGSAVAIVANIFLLGGSNQKYNYRYGSHIEYEEIDKYKYNEVLVKSSMPDTLQNGNIYIIYGNTYTTKLLEQLILDFASVFLYKDNETPIYPIYYGNGEEWVKILN